MSGTSMDGLDICFAEFSKNGGTWNFNMVLAETLPFPSQLKAKLTKAMTLSGIDLVKLDHAFGKFSGEAVNKILRKNSRFKPSLIASHGHTVFHKPEKGITLQIGNGSEIFAATGIPVVSDFRSLDVALGGQGAPLVPVGDELLFSDFDACLNLGGIANFSFLDKNKKRIAYDISPCNIPLNFLARKKGKEMDKNGAAASKGKIDKGLLEQLNQLDYYPKKYPKSLGREWIDDTFISTFEPLKITIENKLATVTEHIAIQISSALKSIPKTIKKPVILCTGGGVYNRFLMDRLNAHFGKGLHIPDNRLIQYKEALIFGFLGLLHALGEINTLKSVTGAVESSSGGTVFGSVLL